MVMIYRALLALSSDGWRDIGDGDKGETVSSVPEPKAMVLRDNCKDCRREFRRAGTARGLGSSRNVVVGVAAGVPPDDGSDE